MGAMKSTQKTTVRKVAKNTVQVSSTATRSAITGRFVTGNGGTNRFLSSTTTGGSRSSR